MEDILPRWLPQLTPSVLQYSLASIFFESLPPGPLPVAWAFHRMAVSEQSHFLIDGWFPTGEKWKLLSHLRATHGTSKPSFLSSCMGQSCHRTVQIKESRNRHYLFMKGVPIINQPCFYSPSSVIPVQYLYNFSREFAFNFLTFC